MKRSEILNLNSILSKSKITNLNRNARHAVLKNHTATFKLAQEINEFLEEGKKKIVEGLDVEITLLLQYRKEFKTADKARKEELVKKVQSECFKAVQAENELNEFANSYLNEEIDVEIVKMDRDDFIDMCSESGMDLTPTDLMNLEFLFE